jgi:chromosome segregation ATPase
MANRKPDKSVSGMSVLNDIRGLLSSNRDQSPASKSVPDSVSDTSVAITRLEEKVRQLEDLVEKQKTDLNRLTREKQELTAKLTSLQSNGSIASSSGKVGVRDMDISILEAREQELNAALSHLDELLQFKTKELVRRISRIYEEAGDFEAGRDFRKLNNQLEAAENFGEFIRSLLRA